MSDATGAREAEEFAALLRELKDRSGLSYGALAKRLHTSTSTLHRYCNGTTVPNEYAPVERLARVCRATPQELMQLHRRWILADAARGLRGDHATAAGAGAGEGAQARSVGTAAGAGEGAEARSEAGAGAGGQDQVAAESATAADAAQQGRPAGSNTAPGTSRTADTGAAGDAERATAPQPLGEDGAPDEPVVVRVAPGPVSPRRRRTALIASAGVAALLVAAVLAAHPPWDGGTKDARVRQAAAEARASRDPDTADPKEPSAAPSTHRPSRSPSASASSAKPRSSGAGVPVSSPKHSTTAGPAGGAGADAVALTVATRPYVYDNPCSQHFLVDSAPAQVGPPANEVDATRWAAAYGAVSSGDQRVALTVQGTGADTVVLEALHVSVETRGAPLAWNDYAMGVGCGGGVDTKSFDVDLDNGSPTATVKNGQRDFPYKVSESDPEVFFVTAHTKAHDVRWELTLDWSSGNRHGTVRVDNNGTPFRTSADAGRPGYDYPLGGSDWIARTS
ncbi:transcriptional regulator [Streptomyces sp. NBC_01497]|uniref:transcriptional regulator n=1 Tax=Streptomyces sp. NBC_01497 TaxID=2903885 RepID=UPI002E334028|nr:helix-turn-helix domain-containing protein [Streptomyces sp. NBC_01497]